MPRDVNPRPYRSAARATAAAETRRRIVAAAGSLFAESGYVGTTVAQVAARADVAVDTVYTSVGRKPQLVLAVVDDILGGEAGPVPAEQRDYVVAVRAAPDARAKLTTYASAMGRIAPRLAPVVAALVRAGEDDAECRAVALGLEERRAGNMRLMAADLRVTGELRSDLDDAAVADVIWSTNAMEYFQLVQRRGWSPERYAAHLTDLWIRMLLAP